MARWPSWTITIPAALALFVATYALTRPDHPVLMVDPQATGVVQSRLSSHPQWMVEDGVTIKALAGFSLTARVLSTKRYRHDGIHADLAPLDLALGWGPMSDPGLAGKLNVRQSGRWYHYSWTGAPPADPRMIASHSSNMHIIPANDTTRAVLLSLEPGDLVSLSGHLVSVQAPGGWRWKSSMSRNDTGAGACELFRVEYVLRHATSPAPAHPPHPASLPVAG